MGPRKYRDIEGGKVSKRVLRRHFNSIWDEYILLRIMESQGIISSFDVLTHLEQVIKEETGGFCAIIVSSTGNYLFKVFLNGNISPTVNLSNDDSRELSDWFHKIQKMES